MAQAPACKGSIRLPPENGEGLRPAKVPMREIQSPEKGSSLWEGLPPENGEGAPACKGSDAGDSIS